MLELRGVFFPGHRKAKRQKFCSTPGCQYASKSASQAALLAKPQKRDYFSHPMHVAQVASRNTWTSVTASAPKVSPW